MSEDFRGRLVRAALRCGALKLDGPYTLKSGRQSPYFFDASRFCDGESLAVVGDAFISLGQQVLPNQPPTVMFGPAYKGVPLAVAGALAAARAGFGELGWLFDRKEAKTHGENTSVAGAKALLVGHPLSAGDRIVMVDDVITTAGTKYEAVSLLREAAPDAAIQALLVLLDREEPGEDGRLAREAFSEKTGVPVHSVLTARGLVSVLRGLPEADAVKLGVTGAKIQAVEDYLGGDAA